MTDSAKDATDKADWSCPVASKNSLEIRLWRLYFLSELKASAVDLAESTWKYMIDGNNVMHYYYVRIDGTAFDPTAFQRNCPPQAQGYIRKKSNERDDLAAGNLY